MLGNLDVVVAIDTEDVLYQVGLALYVHAVAGNSHAQYAVVLSLDGNVQCGDDTFDGCVVNRFANESASAVERNVKTEGLELGALDVDNLARNLTTCQLLEQHSRTFQSVNSDVGVDTALKAERCVGVQTVTFCSFADAHGVEVCALDKQIGGCVAHAAEFATEYTCDTHRFLGVANHQIVGR